ncbi:hypothetical protein SELMODRAFT_414988 [Selaginella moellendorffii]|uniref:dolichyl-phosphate beta-glucosyltransferase n=1 Tax=Selaginella moellendorffii TaxID=88036 RepID=D8RU85_SELML|nr:dolichyl-phosphate beta-glucosyltransferase ALG5D [Selaginella moellendorffii]EFJ24158.1 hypothetical protein SELMODRAFT_414988 [Selaginella moellendorffii]|eukprot:XP_002974638.1 dolichyl-phosphate beta-glucosyltransferase ALG5D [Selaginella moellendorffii]
MAELALVVTLALAIVWRFRLNMLDLDVQSRRDEIFWMEDTASTWSTQVLCPSIHEAPSKYLSVVIPAYNEEKGLPSTINETLRYLDERSFDDANFTYEVTIIDDGSEDLTYNVTLDHASRLRVIKQTPNLGKGAAIRKGVLCSRGQLVITADADSAIFIRDMGKLEEKALNLTASGDPIAVFGSRCKVKQPLLRSIMSKVFHALAVLITGTDVADTQCGLKLFTRPAAARLFTNLRLQRWAFDVELIYLARRLGIPVYEVAVNAVDVTGSKLRASSVCHALYEITMVVIAYGLGFWEIR